MPKFFASGQIASSALSSAHGVPHMPVGLPSFSIATELKLASEQCRATGGEARLLSEEELPRSRRFGLTAVVVGGRKVLVGAGGTKVAVNAGGGREVPVDAGGGKVAGALAVAVVKFVATALMMSSVG